MRALVNRHSATLLHPWAAAWISAPLTVKMLLVGYNQHNPSWPSFAGAIVAVLGVLTVGRPIIRLGYAEWYKQSTIIDAGNWEPSAEDRQIAIELERDAQAFQLSGPILIIAGTLLNGASGFLV